MVSENERIVLQGDIPFIRTEEARLVLMDTPGPNNSRDSRHRECTLRMIRGSQMSMVLYILNATNLSANDDCALLRIVADEMKSNGKQSSDRFIFVLNRVDAVDPERDNVQGMINNARKYLEDNGISNPNILPVSAQLGKLIRVHKMGHILSRKEGRDLALYRSFFIEEELMHLCQYMENINPGVRDTLYNRIEKAKELNDLDEIALLHSGIAAVEEVIQEYLRKYALPMKIHQAVGSFFRILEREKVISNLNEQMQKDAKCRESVHIQITNIESKLAQGKKAKKYKETLDQYKWKSSDGYKKTESSIGVKKDRILREFQDRLMAIGEGRIENVEEKIRNEVIRCQESYYDLECDLKKIVNKEVENVFKEFLNGYRSHIQNIIGGIDRIEAPVISSITVTLNIPDIEYIIKQNEKTVTVVTREEWKAPIGLRILTLGLACFAGKKRVTESRTVVDSKDVAEEISDDIRAGFDEATNKMPEVIGKSVEKLKSQFIQRIEELDILINETIKELKASTQSQNALDEVIRSNEEKVLWVDKFIPRLEEVLSVD
jgi:hypothetical protein